MLAARLCRIPALLLGLCIGCAAALADPPVTPPGAVQYATPTTLAVTTSSGRAAFAVAPSAAPYFQFGLVINDGAAGAFVAVGNSAVVATTSSLPVPAGACIPLYLGSNTDIAGITSANSTTLRVIQATGPIPASCPGAAGSGTISGTVTANQGTAAAVTSAWPTYGITFKRIDVTATVQNAAYSSGNDIGGLISFTLDRTASGLLQSAGIQFTGGATTAINATCFDSNPSSSTFTDKGTFSIAAADEAKRINKTMFSLTPVAQTGDTTTAASIDNYAQPFNSTGTIYCAYVSTGTFTPAATDSMRVYIRVGQSTK